MSFVDTLMKRIKEVLPFKNEPTKKDTSKKDSEQFVFTVTKVWTDTGFGTSIGGKVESGKIAPGEMISTPAGKLRVSNLQRFKDDYEYFVKGYKGTLIIKEELDPQKIPAGSVITK